MPPAAPLPPQRPRGAPPSTSKRPTAEPAPDTAFRNYTSDVIDLRVKPSTGSPNSSPQSKSPLSSGRRSPKASSPTSRQLLPSSGGGLLPQAGYTYGSCRCTTSTRAGTSIIHTSRTQRRPDTSDAACAARARWRSPSRRGSGRLSRHPQPRGPQLRSACEPNTTRAAPRPTLRPSKSNACCTFSHFCTYTIIHDRNIVFCFCYAPWSCPLRSKTPSMLS